MLPQLLPNTVIPQIGECPDDHSLIRTMLTEMRCYERGSSHEVGNAGLLQARPGCLYVGRSLMRTMLTGLSPHSKEDSHQQTNRHVVRDLDRPQQIKAANA